MPKARIARATPKADCRNRSATATTLNNFSAPALVAHAIGATGPTFAISTACSSSAKVFAAAARLMQADWIDAAIVGGVDSLCLTTLCGFSALELLSPRSVPPV